MKLGEAEKFLRELDSQMEMKRTVRESLIDIPPNDVTRLFYNFATPEEFEKGDSVSNESVTRENATSNLSLQDYKIIVTIGSIRSNFIHLLKSEFRDDKNIQKIVDMIGDDIIIRATTSKGLGGWLGNLVITSRKLADVSMANIKEEGKKLFGLRR